MGIIVTAVVGIFSVAIFALLGVSAFFTVNWIKRQEAAVHKLNNTLTAFQLTFEGIAMDVRRVLKDVEEHDLILRNMPKLRCNTEGCPYYDPDAPSPLRYGRNHREGTA